MLRNLAAAALSVLFAISPSGASDLVSQRPAEASSSQSSWQLPFETPHRLVRQYLQPASDYSAGHRGVDYAVTTDDIIVAPNDGVVGFAGKLVNRPVLALNHPGGLKTEFEPACTTLVQGDSVLAGDPIGTVCPADVDYTQHCPVVLCLHFSLRLNNAYLSPLALIGGLNPSRLLPYSER